MIIKEAKIGKFGKLENVQYQFSPQINVIYGPNESGKSTLMQFLKAMLFGLEKTRVRKTLDAYNKYEPWDTPAYFYGSMIFETGNQEFLLERNFYHKERRVRLVNVRDGEELSVEYGDLDMLLGNVSAAAYENTCCIGQEQLLPGRELGVLLEDERSNLAQTGSGAFQLSEALQELEQKRKNTEKKRKELEQQRLSKIRRLEVKQQVLEQNVSELKAQQSRQSTQQDTMQEQTLQLQRSVEPLQERYQSVCQQEQKLQKTVARQQAAWEQLKQECARREQLEWEESERKRARREQLEWEQSERKCARREQLEWEDSESEDGQKSGKSAGFSPLLLLGVSGLILAPILRASIDGFQKIAPILNVICIILILTGLISAYNKNKKKKSNELTYDNHKKQNDSEFTYARHKELNSSEHEHGQNDFEQLKAQSAELEQKKTILEQRLSQIQEEKSSLENQLRDLKNQQKSLQLQSARQEGSGDQLQNQLQEKEVELENLSEQTAELQLETQEEKDARSDCEALELAANTMSRLAAQMSKTLEYTLDKEMSAILTQITDAVHNELQMADARKIMLLDQTQKRVPESYSQGTMQQAYFSYRMAAGKLLTREESLPFLLDETFASYDEMRLRQTLRWLAEQENQIFLFACRDTEIRLLQEEGIPFQKICL